MSWLAVMQRIFAEWEAVHGPIPLQPDRAGWSDSDADSASIVSSGELDRVMEEWEADEAASEARRRGEAADSDEDDL